MCKLGRSHMYNNRKHSSKLGTRRIIVSTKEQEIYREFYAKYKSKMSDDATEIAKIVENNFDQVAQTTTSYGASQKLIVRLWDDQKSVSSGASSTVPATNSPEIKLDYLKSITVEDFRGFQAKQSFEFGRRFTFIYGRNGTGKTSLTNAIEYALLNEIQDAKYARIPETNYITNVYTKKYRIPELIGVTQDNQARTVRYDAQKYRFAIIERNRIENFSRMSAETPAIQTERLATLVGLDGWNVFFKRFGKSIHTQLEFEESIQPKVEAQKGALEKLQVSLKKFLNSSSSLSKEVDHLKVEYQVDTVEALEKKLDDHSKKLAKKITNLTPENPISLTNIELLRKAQEGVLIDLEKLLKYRDELTSYKEQLDLSDLAEALIKIQPIQRSQDEICPACQSILYDAQGNLIVPVDPFDHAGEVLSKFESAKKLEAKLKHEQATVTSAVGNINRLIDAVSVDISHEGLSFSDSDKKSLLTRKLQKEVLLGAGFKITKDEQIGVSDELIQTITTVITAYNETQEKNRTALSEANTEKLSIDASITKVKDWKSSNAVTKDQETGLKTQIFDEKEAYDNLCKKQAQLDERNKQRKVKEDAYAEFYNFLKQFTAELPVQELTGLSSQVLSLYNLINRYDSQSEQLDGLEIPANSKGNILVRPKVADASYANALDVLSEGHIRSLGLAILLAKAIQTEQKFIIFDDVVNSIDNDHRKAIAQIITSNDKPFADIQWIVTTHGQ